MPSESLPGGLDRDQLRQAQKMELLGDLAPGVAHELNNPLTAILAFSQLLLGDPRLPDDLRHDARLLVLEADRTQRIVKNLLDFVRRRPPERQPTDVRVLVQAAIDLHAYALIEQRIDIELVIPDEVPPVEVDRSAMQQVLLNLISVAAHEIAATNGRDRRGQISISAAAVTASPRPLVRISIVDDARSGAPVIPAPAAAEATSETERRDEVALTVAEALTAAHDGHISIERHPGAAGSTTTVEIPVTADAWSAPDDAGAQRPEAAIASAPPAQSAPSARTRGQSTNGRHPRVLVLDDEAPIRGLLRRALQHHGFESTLAADGDEALQVLRGRSFDVLLVDHRMPRVDGLEFHRRALEMRPDVAGRVVFMTGDVMDAALQSVAEAAPVRVLGKPFELEAVGRIVAEVIAANGLAAD